MNARLSQADAAYALPFSTTPDQERVRAQRLAAAEAYQAGLVRSLRHGLARVGDALFGWVKRARIRAELDSLSDRDLADIGLTRSDFARVLGEADAAPEQRQAPRPAGFGAPHAA